MTDNNAYWLEVAKQQAKWTQTWSQIMDWMQWWSRESFSIKFKMQFVLQLLYFSFAWLHKNLGPNHISTFCKNKAIPNKKSSICLYSTGLSSQHTLLHAKPQPAIQHHILIHSPFSPINCPPTPTPTTSTTLLRHLRFLHIDLPALSVYVTTEAESAAPAAAAAVRDQTRLQRTSDGAYANSTHKRAQTIVLIHQKMGSLWYTLDHFTHDIRLNSDSIKCDSWRWIHGSLFLNCIISQ